MPRWPPPPFATSTFGPRQLKRAQIRGLIAANRKGLLIGAATAVALFAGIVVVPRILRAPEEISVSVTTDVAGVSIAVGEKNCVTPNCVFKLAPGTYTLQAAKVGYKSLSRQFYGCVQAVAAGPRTGVGAPSAATSDQHDF